MLQITQGLTRNNINGFDKLTFEKYDKNSDGIIDFAEFNNFLEITGINRVQRREPNKNVNKGFDVEQFDPKGPINFESNGGHNSKFLNIIA